MTASPAIAAFRKLHESGCFVLPNPWDIGSAKLLQHAGFQAIATTSAGVAFTRGLPDEVWALPRNEMLTHIREMVTATALPVNADFQTGYANDLEELAANIVACVDTGVAGLSIEDATGEPSSPLFERAEAIERVKVARAAIDGTGIPVVLTARCEAYLVKHPDAERIALDRLVAFAEAGADCLYAPTVVDPAQIAAIVKAVAPRPVNVLVSSSTTGLTIPKLTELGVRRVSVGSALARVALGAFLRSVRHIAQTGTFDSFGDAASFAELNAVFTRQPG